MDLLTGEEKKEARDEFDTKGGSGQANYGSDSEDTECEELVDLPEEIQQGLGGRDRVYESDDELQAALVNAGVGDLPVVLVDGKPLLVMPSDQHNAFTSRYVNAFAIHWRNWGCCSGTHKIHLSHGKSRDPDMSFWGYPRCRRNEMWTLEPVDLGKGAIPDVVIQFSWQNKVKYEVDAIDDMMNRGLEKDHGALSLTLPKVGYLIKVRFSRKRRLTGAVKGSKTQDMEGLDIYRLPHGTTVADAHDATNQEAEVWRYKPGGPERMIVITPQDLGIRGFSAWLCGDYKIKASELFQTMRQYHTNRQADGLAT